MDAQDDPGAGLDSYERKHLAAHLIAAERLDDLHRLLALGRVADEPVPEPATLMDRLLRRRRTRAVLHNLWYTAHQTAADATGYQADIALARRHSTRIGLELRYMLIEASVQGLEGRIPAELVLAMVDAGLWTLQDGINRATILPYPARAKALSDLAPRLPGDERAALLEQELLAARGIGDAANRAESFRTLAPSLTDAARAEALTQALDAIEQIEYDEDRADVLVAVAECLSDDLGGRAAAIGARIGDHAMRADALASLLPALPETHRQQAEDAALQAVESLRRMPKTGANDTRRTKHLTRAATALVKLAAHHGEPHRSAELVEAARLLLLNDGSSAANSSALPLRVIRYLPEPDRTNALAAELVKSAKIQRRQDRVRAMTAIVPLWHGSVDDIARLAWADARKLKLPGPRLAAIGALISYLPEPSRSEAAELGVAALAQVSIHQPAVSTGLAALAPHLPPSMLPSALRAPWTSSDKAAQVDTLTVLLPHLPAANQPDFMRAIIRVVESMEQRNKVSAWVTIVRWPAEPWHSHLLLAALKSVSRLKYRSDRADGLDALAPYSRHARVLRKAPTAIRYLPGSPNLKAALLSIWPAGSARARTARAFAAAVQQREESSRAASLRELAADVAGTPMVSKLLDVVNRMDDAFQRLEVFRALVPHLDDSLRAQVMPEVVAALTNRGDTTISETACELAEYFPASSLPAVLRSVTEIQHDPSRAAALAALAPHLPRTLLENALAAARSIRIEERVHVLAALAPRLPANRRAEIIEEALADSGGRSSLDRALLLNPMLPWMPSPDRQDLLHEAVQPAIASGAVTDELLSMAAGNRDAVAQLAPRLSEADLDEIHHATAGLGHHEALLEIVSALANYPDAVDPSTLNQTLRLVLAQPSSRAELLAGIARLAHVITRLGGETAALEVAKAVVDVGSWWQ